MANVKDILLKIQAQTKLERKLKQNLSAAKNLKTKTKLGVIDDTIQEQVELAKEYALQMNAIWEKRLAEYNDTMNICYTATQKLSSTDPWPEFSDIQDKYETIYDELKKYSPDFNWEGVEILAGSLSDLESVVYKLAQNNDTLEFPTITNPF